MTKISIAVLATLFAAGTVDASDNKPQLEMPLRMALINMMLTTYTCQDHIGGLDKYEESMKTAVDLLTRFSGNSGQATQIVADADRNIRAMDHPERLEKRFPADTPNSIQPSEVCANMMESAHSSLDTVQTRLGWK